MGGFRESLCKDRFERVCKNEGLVGPVLARARVSVFGFAVIWGVGVRVFRR